MHYALIKNSPCDDLDIIKNYTGKNNIRIHKIITFNPQKKSLFSSILPEDCILCADISVFGNSFQSVINTLCLTAPAQTRIYAVKDDILIDNSFPRSFNENAATFLRIYKSILSVQNRKIQQSLLKSGKKRGRPFNSKNKSSIFSGKEIFIRQALCTGKSKKFIANTIGCSRSSVYKFITNQMEDIK